VKSIRRLSTLAGTLTLLALSPLASGEMRQIGGAGLTVFRDSEFRGNSASIREDMPNLRSIGMNDRISSFKVAPGERWEVCEHANYQGRCVEVSGEERNLANTGWNDKISSVRRLHGGSSHRPDDDGGYIVLYDEPRYRGRTKNIDGPRSSLKDFNDRARSITVGRGVWEVCEHKNYGGRCVILDRSTSDLDSVGLSRQISSVRPAAAQPR
jgi:hypothetical protein